MSKSCFVNDLEVIAYSLFLECGHEELVFHIELMYILVIVMMVVGLITD